MGAAFSVPSMLPLSIFFFQQESNEHFYMGMLVLIYVNVTIFSSRLMYKATRKSILLGLDNKALVNNLEQKIEKINDISSKLSHQASHDTLTGLINRAEFEFRLKKVIQEAKIHKKTISLCYMDLDEFKVVNDTCGHIAGDALLKELSLHLQSKIRSTDTFARIGGDEFGLLLPYCNIEKAHEIADNIRQIIKQFRFIWQDKTFEIGVSIGLVEINEQSGNLTDILKAADSACYVAKDLGRNRIHVYTENDLELTARLGHMNCAQDIQKALNEDRFTLYVQKIQANDTNDDKWHGEILIRMLSEENEIIPPINFIPAAERYHLMVDIDKWVIDNAFLFIKELEEKFNHSVLCAINLSGQSICDKHFLEHIINKLDETKISPKSVCFEITETAAVTNFFYAEKLLDVLKKMGCSFSLDDFGSGLSSFGYLKRLDIDYLKIDGSFVKNILEDEKDFAIVKAINQIGKEMGIKTIAEFVENDALHKKLDKLGVDFVQGYGIAKPVPISTII